MKTIGTSGLPPALASARTILLGKAGLLVLALTLAPMTVGSHGKLLGSSAAFAESSSNSQDHVQLADTPGADDGANHDANDDNSIDKAGDGTDDGPDHDLNDDHGDDQASSGSDDGAGHDANDDHGSDGANSGSSGSGGSGHNSGSGSGGGGHSGHGGGGDGGGD